MKATVKVTQILAYGAYVKRLVVGRPCRTSDGNVKNLIKESKSSSIQ